MGRMREQLTTSDAMTLVETGRELAAEVNIKALLERILQRASELTNSPDGSVILYDETTEALYFAAATGKSAKHLLETWGEFSQRKVPLYGSKSGEVFRTGQSLVQQAVARDLRHFKGVDRDIKRQTKSMVCVPLEVGNQRLGVMQILNKKSGRYTRHDQILLEHFADQAAVAIRNAKLFESLLAHMGLYASRELNEGPTDLMKELNKPARLERMSVMFADMRGFTQLCQMLNNPKRIQEMLNEFLSMMASSVIAHQGLVNKFLGDGLLGMTRISSPEKNGVKRLSVH